MVRNRDLRGLKHNFMNFLVSIILLTIIIMTSVILYATLMPLLLLQQLCTCICITSDAIKGQFLSINHVALCVTMIVATVQGLK